MGATAAEAILQRLPTVTEQEVRMLSAFWQGCDASLRRRAWEHGKRALRARRAEGLLEDANDAVGRWLRDYATGRIGMYSNVLDASFRDQDRMESRMQAAPAVMDAVLGTLIGDALPDDEAAVLLAPWDAVIEGEEMPLATGSDM